MIEARGSPGDLLDYLCDPAGLTTVVSNLGHRSRFDEIEMRSWTESGSRDDLHSSVATRFFKYFHFQMSRKIVDFVQKWFAQLKVVTGDSR